MARRLLLLNGVAAACAVTYHALGWGFTSMFWWTDRYAAVMVPDFSAIGTPTYLGLRALEQFVSFGVTAFLFVSGYFVAFAAGREGTLGWGRVQNRLKMLLVPYALWSIVIFVGRFAEGRTDTLLGYTYQLFGGHAAQPYYYVPLVTQLYLLAPLIVVWCRKFPKTVLVSSGLVHFGLQAARYPAIVGADISWAPWVVLETPSWFFLHQQFWFVFGVFAGFHTSGFSQVLAKWRWALPWVTVLLGVLGIAEWELLLRLSGQDWLSPTLTALDSVYAMAFIMLFLSAFESGPAVSRQLDTLGAKSFGIYLIHAPVLELFSRGSYHLMPVLLGHQFIFMTSLVLVGIGVPLLMMAVVNRTPARPCHNYLFG